MNTNKTAKVVVIGAGPGGYAAAFRASDLGFKTILIEKHNVLGGVCLNVGCIPSKALLHISKTLNESLELKKMGIEFKKPHIELDKIKKWKSTVISKLNKGIESLCKARNIKVIQGTAKFLSNKQLIINSNKENFKLDFDYCIIATGSSPKDMLGFPKDNRIMNSTDALKLDDIPKKLLIVGGGYIGLEMGSIYESLGSEITVVEYLPNLLPGADPDLVKPLERKLKRLFKNILTDTKVESIDNSSNSLEVHLSNKNEKFKIDTDKVLISIGRAPNTKNIGLENTKIKLLDNGFIKTNNQLQTSVKNIYAIGDITGDPMLAHKATFEGKVAAESIAGLPSENSPKAIPAVIFTDPEIAWAGLTETEAKEKNIPYEKGEFPWIASGKAISHGRTEGKTKTLYDPETKQILGIGIVGTNAGDMIAEGVLAIEMCTDVEDISLTIHPHPTLSESIGNSAEVFHGTVTDLYIPPKKHTN